MFFIIWYFFVIINSKLFSQLLFIKSLVSNKIVQWRVSVSSICFVHLRTSFCVVNGYDSIIGWSILHTKRNSMKPSDVIFYTDTCVFFVQINKLLKISIIKLIPLFFNIYFWIVGCHCQLCLRVNIWLNKVDLLIKTAYSKLFGGDGIFRWWNWC